MNVQDYTLDIIFVVIIVAAAVSFFWNPLTTDMRYLQTLAGGIVGFFIGFKDIPVARLIKKSK